MPRTFPKCLRVMAEYGSSGIWVVEPAGPFRHGMIAHRKLDLPRELADQFREWIDSYWKVLDAPDKFDVAEFNRTGRELAIALKKHVGPDTKVVFAPEDKDGGLASEQEITG